MRSFPALKYSSLALNAFVPGTKNVNFQHNKRVHLQFGRWLRKTPKKDQTRGKVSVNVLSGKDRPENGAETRQRGLKAKRLPYICCAIFADVW